jgi:Zn-dependent M28 family amino/carboxypeptidase
MVSLPKSGKVGPPIASVLHGPGAQLERFPQQHVSGAVANQLLAGSDVTLDALADEIVKAKAPRSRALSSSATMTVAARYRPDQPTANVVAILPGADPELRGQAVVLGAHLDHVGSQAGVLWPGANDNASGAAVLLAVAEAFAKSHRPPRRTLIFVLFAAEEQGLNGSRWFAERMPYTPANVAAMLNVDCVGHGEKLQLGGGKSAPHLWELARTLDAGGDRITVEETWGGGGADATPFHEKGIPTLYFATTKSYTHLHQASDRPETLDPSLLERVARLVFRTARSVSDGAYDRETVNP